MKILYIEDIAYVRTKISNLLKSFGYFVHEAKDGEEAIKMLTSNYYDIVLLDLGLPKVNGMKLAKYIKTTYGSKVIIITGNADADIVSQCLEVGVDDYIVKPIDEKRLLYAVRKAMLLKK